eukprot:CAMPEP_0118890888 /NCGR_PEP_ID=MMETSP1166-20130328/1142_1 /TAXON_ID=1104430 /ORGANISM="Chrysoreinhardia sp, Strain CCMP3193" /LENGTH=554 /DNA_ID=CAMNT_0006829519 /DNA_START=217 /DNA_END=1881 /DNA_ORIENTATION=-
MAPSPAGSSSVRVGALNLSAAVGRFVVLTQPRSGSTWFVKYSESFAKCSGVVTSGEIMHPAVLAKWSERVLGKRVRGTVKHAEYLRYLHGFYELLGRGEGWRGEFEEHSSLEDSSVLPDVRAVGFKLMYTQLPRLGPGAPVGAGGMMRNVTLKGFLKYAAANNVVVIHLTRLNHLERLISLEAIRRSNLSYHVTGSGAPTRYSHRSMEWQHHVAAGSVVRPSSSLSWSSRNLLGELEQASRTSETSEMTANLGEQEGHDRVYNATTTDVATTPMMRYASSSKARGASGVFLNVTAAHAFARSQLRQNRELQAFLDRYCTKFGTTCRTVAYEHLIGDHSRRYFDGLREAIGVSKCHSSSRQQSIEVLRHVPELKNRQTAATSPPLSSKSRELRSTWVPCSQRVVNFDDLAQSHQFANSAWLDMCRNANRIPQWLEDASYQCNQLSTGVEKNKNAGRLMVGITSGSVVRDRMCSQLAVTGTAIDDARLLRLDIETYEHGLKTLFRRNPNRQITQYETKDGQLKPDDRRLNLFEPPHSPEQSRRAAGVSVLLPESPN